MGDGLAMALGGVDGDSLVPDRLRGRTESASRLRTTRSPRGTLSSSGFCGRTITRVNCRGIR